MNLEDLKSLIDSSKLDELKTALEATKDISIIADALGVKRNFNKTLEDPYFPFAQYNPKWHDVHDPTIRFDKEIKNEAGEPQRLQPVTRISLPIQKKITLLAAAFLGSPAIESTPAEGIETDTLDAVKKIWEDNKLDYKFREISKRTMSEKECAELWFTQPAEADYWEDTKVSGSFKLRMRIISPALGDKLFPVYDNFGDMIAFGRWYEAEDQTPGAFSAKKEKIKHFDIYTADTFYFSKFINGAWNFATGLEGKLVYSPATEGAVTGIANMIKKIPVIYYSQQATEWHDVQEMIDRLEKKLSNHADTNDYFDSPILVATGDVKGFADKGEQGKLIEIESKEGTLQYLTWDNAPESMKMEIDNLDKYIHEYTHTPRLLFENIKGLGAFSGVALKMFFMDAHLKASDKEEQFGECVQRRINYLKSAISVIDGKFKAGLKLKATPKFEFFLPANIPEMVQTLTQAVTGGIMSTESAIKANPLVEDGEAELGVVQAETTAKQAHDLAKAQATTKIASAAMSN